MDRNKKRFTKGLLIYLGLIILMTGLYIGLILLNVKIIYNNPLHYSIFVLIVFSIIGLILLIIFIVFLTRIIKNINIKK